MSETNDTARIERVSVLKIIGDPSTPQPEFEAAIVRLRELGVTEAYIKGWMMRCSNPEEFADGFSRVTKNNPSLNLAVEEDLTPDDASNGRRFVLMTLDGLRYCPSRAKDNSSGWFWFDGQRWMADESGSIPMECARKIIQDAIERVQSSLAEDEAIRANTGEVLQRLIGKTKSDDPRLTPIKELNQRIVECRRKLEFLKASLSNAKLNAQLAQARQSLPLYAAGSAFDAHPELLNLANGTYSLTNNEFYEARAEDMLTQLAPVTYDPAAACPKWEAYLDLVTQGDAETQMYLQRVCGYVLCGEQSAQKMFIIAGQGGTGKSTFRQVLQGILGEYYQTTADYTFVKSKFSDDGTGASPNLVQLVGKRVAASTEMTDGCTFEEGILKKITGGDDMSIRQLFCPNFDYRMQCKPIFFTNYIPNMTDFSDAMRQRLAIVKFEHVLRGTDQEIDDYYRVLLEESSGILNWMLAGWKAYQKGGLREPEVVKSNVSEYVTEQDVVARWAKGTLVPQPNGRVLVAEAFASFRLWAEANGEKCSTAAWFGRRMGQAGYKVTRSNQGKFYEGYLLPRTGHDDFMLEG